MKKKWTLVLAFLVCLSELASCKTPEAEDSTLPSKVDSVPMQDPSMPADNEFHPETDYQYSWGGGVPGPSYFQRTLDGLYFVGGDRLYFIDEETTTPQLCCIRPDCSHHWDEEDCTAVGTYDGGIQYMDGRFYYIDSHDPKKGYQFCSMDSTGNNRKLLVDDYPRSVEFVIHRGYLYSYYLEFDASQNSNAGSLILTQISLKDPSMRKTLWTKSVKEENGDIISPGEITAFGNYLIFSRHKEDGISLYIELYSLNLQTGEWKQFSSLEGAKAVSFKQVGDRVVVETIQPNKEQRFFSFSLTLEDPVAYPEWKAEDLEHGEICIGSDTEYLYKWTSDMKNSLHGEMEIMDTEGNVVDTIDLSSVFNEKWWSLRLYSDFKEDGYVLIAGMRLNWGFYFFKKSDIGSGKLELKPLMPVCGTNQYIRPEELEVNPDTLEPIYPPSFY